jgi:putative ABC transport system permease protein
MRDAFSDLRYSLRMLRHNAVFSATAVAALAVGIAANSAIFSVANAVLLKRLPYPDSDRIVAFTTVTPRGFGGGASETKLNAWRDRFGIFKDVSAFRVSFINLTSGDRAEQVSEGQATTDFFRLFGASFQQGREFTAEEERPGGPHVAIVSASFLRRHLGSQPTVLGQTIQIDREPYVIVGVLDPNFDGETLGGPAIGNPDVWLPLPIDPASRDQANNLVAVARLDHGVSIAEGRQALAVVTDEFRRAFPGIIGPQDVFSIESLQDSMVRDVRPSLLVLQGAVGLVLLIACANVAGLLLVRSTTRAREIAIRSALGAGRGRLVRLLLAETLALSTIGGALGLVLGMVGLHALLTLVPADIFLWLSRGGLGLWPDRTVVAFTSLASLVTVVLAGLFPALQASRFDLNVVLRANSVGSGGGGHQRRFRSALVAAETSLALVLLVGAALLGRTFLALRAVDLGFQPRNVLTFRMALGDGAGTNAADVERLVGEATQELRALPGVVVASASCCVPLEGDLELRFLIVGRLLDGAYHGMSSWRSVSPGYFETMQVPLVRGRLFTDQDRLDAPGVVVINETMARQFWPGSDPLADSILIGKGLGPNFASEPNRRIVGIVRDVRDVALNAAPRMTTYVPLGQLPEGVLRQTMIGSPLAWIVRTAWDSPALRRSIGDRLERTSGGHAVGGVRSLSDLTRASTTESVLYVTIFGALSFAALLLAVIGLNGVTIFSVQQRTREFGVRIALGAESRRVRHMVVWQTMRIAVVAVAIGLAAAFALSRFMTKFLFGVEPHDVSVFVVAPAVVITVAFAAVWLATRAMARIDPAHALRAE